MTDKEIGKIAREIAERGNTAEIRRKGNGIIIIEAQKNTVKDDDEQ